MYIITPLINNERRNHIIPCRQKQWINSDFLEQKDALEAKKKICQDNVGHFSLLMDNKNAPKYCLVKYQSLIKKIMCIRCTVYLCLWKKYIFNFSH